MRTSAGFWALALMAAVSGACDGSVAAPAAPANGSPLAPGEVRAEVTPEFGWDGVTTFVVRIRTRDASVTSYQGSIAFPPGALDLLSVTTPSSSNAAYVVNPTTFASGRLPFVVFSTSPFAGTESEAGAEAFRFTARSRGLGAVPALSAMLDVVVNARAEN